MPPKSQAATVEDVSDEDEEPTKKKKKKKPKKKKKKASASEGAAEEPILEEIQPTPPPKPELDSAPAPAPASPAPKKGPAKQPPPKAPSVRSVSSTTASTAPSSTVYGSTTSLPLPTEQTAQSAHAYLKQAGLDSEKTKVKTRADHATLFSIDEDGKDRGIFSRFTKSKTKKAEVDEKGKQSFFGNLKRKSKDYMHQLLSTPGDERKGSAGMRWSHFVKVSSFPNTSSNISF